RLARTEEIWYGSSGATRVQGWIVTPPSFKAGRKYPLLLEIHGGPFAMYNVGFSYMFQNFAANGYVVLFVNPRGSTGYGDRFSYGFFRQPFWEKPDEWLAHAWLMYVGHVTTPTLLMTGELDRRTPIPQTEEYYAALKMRHVPTVMLRFSDEFHGTGSKPSNF